MINAPIAFKEERVQAEFENIPLLLSFVVEDFAKKCVEFSITPIVTRVLETVCGSSGVHEVGRAVDIRDEHEGAFTFSSEEKLQLMDLINKKYYRNDGKPTLIFHSFQGGPCHAHLQIAESNMTYRRT